MNNNNQVLETPLENKSDQKSIDPQQTNPSIHNNATPNNQANALTKSQAPATANPQEGVTLKYSNNSHSENNETSQNTDSLSDAPDEQADTKTQIILAIMKTFKEQKLPYSSSLLQETALVINQSLDENIPFSLPKAATTAMNSLMKKLQDFTRSLDISSLVSLLGEDCIKKIQLIQIEKLYDKNQDRLQDLRQDDRSDKSLSGRTPPKSESTHRGSKSNSGLYLNGFNSRLDA